MQDGPVKMVQYEHDHLVGLRKVYGENAAILRKSGGLEAATLRLPEG